MSIDDERLGREEQVAVAASYLVKIGWLQECEDHGVTYGGGEWDLESDFFKRVMSDRKKGQAGPAPWASQMESREFTDLLKEAYDSHPGDCCESCAANMRDW